MSVALIVHSLSAVVIRLDDGTPEAEDVKAGWTAFALFLLLIAAVVVLCFSFVKQLRKAQAAKDAGVYDDPADATPPKASGSAETPGSSEPENHSTS